MSLINKQIDFIIELITETRKLKADLGIPNKTVPGLYITPSERWQLAIISEMRDQICQMCKVDNVIIVPNSYNDSSDAAHVFMSASTDDPLIQIIYKREN